MMNRKQLEQINEQIGWAINKILEIREYLLAKTDRGMNKDEIGRVFDELGKVVDKLLSAHKKIVNYLITKELEESFDKLSSWRKRL